MTTETLADDLLSGGEEIAKFMFGDAKEKRRVYHMFERGHLPLFLIGQKLHARRSTLIAFVRDQEEKALAKQSAAA